MIKKAFTLAEVLIVIAIIGAVASLTLTNLSDSYKQDNTVVKLKKIQNEIKSAQQQALLKYGDDYNSWYSSSKSENDKKAENINRLLEFLDLSQTGATFPYANYNSNNNYTKVELKDGTLLAVTDDGAGNGEVIVATDGMNGSTLGKNIFGFSTSWQGSGQVEPFGKGEDRQTKAKMGGGSTGKNNLMISNYINATNWAITNENLDYLKCSGLNWETKTSCSN